MIFMARFSNAKNSAHNYSSAHNYGESTMMIVSHRIGIGSDTNGSRYDRIANVGSRITNVRLCNGKVTDRIAIVTAVLTMRSSAIHNRR
jgi:hypothetical protein